MNSNVIQFACGHCQSSLTVPSHMAGVAGPCPKCGNHIVSPQPQEAFEPAPAAIPVAPAAAWPPAPAEQAARPPTGGLPPTWPGMGLNLPPQDPVAAVASIPAGSSLPRPMQGGNARDVYPPAPAAAPLIPPPSGPVPWGQPSSPAQPAPDTGGLPGGYPLHSQGLRPNAGLPAPGSARGAVLPPPAAPVNPVAGLLGQMPGGLPLGGQPGMLTRPQSVGGSRLSLLARQLTTGADGTQGLPVAPAPLSTSELPGQAPTTYVAPDGSRNQQASAMLLKQNMRRGLQVSSSPRGGRGKFALVAVLMLGLLGALVWQYRAPLKDIVTQVFPPKPSLPEPGAPPVAGPVPGVDKIVGNPGGATDTEPTTKVLNKTVVARSIPTPEPIQESKSVPPPPVEPVGTPREVAPLRPSTPPGPELMATTPTRRATAVDDPPAETEVRPARTVEPAPPPNPLTNSQQKMVEVGRTNTEPKMAQSIPPAPTPALGAGPTVKNVPPVCKPALEGLLGFLGAKNWHERLKYTQLADQIESKVKMYYASTPDGPVDVDEIQYLRHDEDPQVGRGLHAVFVLFSRNWEFGFPIMVEVTPDGARVDWLTFIEFKDDMLNKFLSHYMEERVQFHVGIHRTHYFDDNIPGLDHKEQFAISSPMENVRGFVFVPKGPPFARSLASTISWDKEASWVVVELQWRKEGNSKWVEMTALPQLNWYSAPAPAAAAADSGSSTGRPVPAPPGSVAR